MLFLEILFNILLKNFNNMDTFASPTGTFLPYLP